MSAPASSTSAPRGLFRPLVARPTDQPHRAATPLELLFDLTFVAGVSQLAAQLAHATTAGHPGEAVGPFLMVFFAIWWAWMNFTWFASAYDCDDVPYRLAAVVQMGGVIVLAAGIERAFEHSDYVVIAVGYLIMRVGLLSLWLRAAVQDVSSRRTSVRYAVGLASVQAMWVIWLPQLQTGSVAGFAVLAVLELAVPVWAERQVHTTWHPRHIAERYALFALILLGEGVFAATTAVVTVVTRSSGITLVVISTVSLVVVVALWWLYFARSAGPVLAAVGGWSFVWGYGHYLLFIALAAVGAGLDVVISAAIAPPSSPGPVLVALALPVAVFLVMLDLLRVPVTTLGIRWPTVTAVLALALAVVLSARIGLTTGACLVAAVLVATVAVDVKRSGYR